MSGKEFHSKPFDEGTLTKLEIFELYAREWFPVFLSQKQPRFKELHIFDFFSGPGTDAKGVKGSPLRIVDQLITYRNLAGWPAIQKHIHFSDANSKKVAALKDKVAGCNLENYGIIQHIRCRSFDESLESYARLLERKDVTKLLFIDQFGVGAVTDEVFERLIKYPHCDFLFFISSSTLNRFRNHEAIKQKIERPHDAYHVHRCVCDYFRKFIPRTEKYFLGHFSIKKGSNIYGLIFGSAHPKGIHKFLTVAWKKDAISGEANFDVERDNLRSDELLLPLEEFKPKKLQEFESRLESAISNKEMRNEADLIEFCFSSGMLCQHAKPILKKLKDRKQIACDFVSPNVDRFYNPKPISFL